MFTCMPRFHYSPDGRTSWLCVYCGHSLSAVRFSCIVIILYSDIINEYYFLQTSSRLIEGSISTKWTISRSSSSQCFRFPRRLAT